MNRLLNILTALMALCAVIATGAIVRREFLPPVVSAPTGSRPIEIKAWKEVAREGNRFGDTNAKVIITQFSDFQCPYCRRFHEVLTKVEKKYPTDVAFVYRHFPLDRIHPHARPAAHASECAAQLGKFREFHDALFIQQDSIGKRSWSAWALRAGIGHPDTIRFGQCMRGREVLERLRADSISAAQVGVKGTPTVLVNNWLIPGTPTFEKIDSIVSRILRGDKSP